MDTATLDRQALAQGLAAMAKGLGATLPPNLDVGYRHDSTGAPPAAGYAHGPGGLLTFPGIDQAVWSTTVGVRPGILGQLPTRASVFTNPVFETITGIQGSSDANKEDVCDVAPVGGLMKGGKLTAPFGRYEFATREVELNRLGQRNDRADPVDIRLMNNPISGDIFGVNQTPQGNPLVSEMSKVFYERAVFAHRTLSQQIWNGNPANNSDGGGYAEFPGLDLLVNTGHVDAETNLSLPSLDSDVKDANFARVDTDADTIIDALTYMYRFVRNLATTTGADPVRWVFAMRETLFYEITKVWPCAYYLGGCTVVDASGQRIVVDARDQIDLRDQMRSGRFLLIDGIQVEVAVDDGITELTSTTNGNVAEGCFASDIYLLPMSAVGGTATLFMEYFDYENADIQNAIGNMVLAQTRTAGAWIETVRQTLWCVQWQTKIEPRVVLRTPWLAGKLQNVQYCPLQHTRDPFPTDPYFVNGGETSRIGRGPSYYALWQS